MVNDAAAHAEEDKKFHDLIAARNQADTMIHAIEKSMKEAGASVTEEEKKTIENAISELKEALKGENKELIEQKTQALTEASSKMAERLYAQSSKQQTGGEPGSEKKPDENVVEAEFEEVKEDTND
jgi:molecular chaperone DnaK